MSTLFISHSSRDNTLAKDLEERLEKKDHHSVFLDLDPEKGIVAGQSWERTLYRKLRSCRAVVALCTDHYLKSHWCFAEIALARMEGKHIFALLVDPLSKETKLPSILTEDQYIDLRTNPEEGYSRLWHGLQEKDLLGLDGGWDPQQVPYLGLSTFQEKHATVFFGREEETHMGIELLAKGAPNLIMVLGASGSGKSSLVRAGILPRLRRQKKEWLIVGPFRPGTDPFSALAKALMDAFKRYAKSHVGKVGNQQAIYDRLKQVVLAEVMDTATAAEQEEALEQTTVDERLQHLLQQMTKIQEVPPENASPRLKTFLDWSLNDLKRICGEIPQEKTIRKGKSTVTPLMEIAADLRRFSEHGQNAHVLLIIDQFEELLGRSKEGDPIGNHFLTLLRKTMEVPGSPIMALGTMRSDFLSAFQRHRALRGIDYESLSLGPVKPEGLRQIIEKPAKLAAIELEEGLSDRLIQDTESSDALPLLSFTLWKLWHRYAQDKELQIAEYERLGGLHGAISLEADSVLDQAQRKGRKEALKKAFLQMARLTDEGNYARQPVSWEQADVAEVADLLKSFVEQRLLVDRMDGEQRIIEVAHEALFHSWKPLKNWLDNHRAELMLRQQLKRDAEAWGKQGEAVDNLWRGGRLQQARELIATGYEPSEEEEHFIRAGWNRQEFRKRVNIGIIVVVIAFLLLLTFWALRERSNAITAYSERDAEKRLSRQLKQKIEELEMADANIAVLKQEKAKVEEELVKQDTTVRKDNRAVFLSNMAEKIEAQKLYYNNENLQDASGILHRVFKAIKLQYPDASFPSVGSYRRITDIAQWYKEQGRLVVVEDALARRDLIVPGAILFFGAAGKTYKDITIDQLLTPRYIQHAGIVTEVTKDAEGKLLSYVLFHARSRGKFAQRTYFHSVEPPTSRKGYYPPLGNWQQQWIAIANPF
ncbi:MAG: toll/interleukin-1 receptor domain-containing protein [Bacteroidota bacterium]